MNSHVLRAILPHRGADPRYWLGFIAVLSLIASCISMAVIYQNPFAHLALCLGGEPGIAQSGTLLLYGHCAWCYLAVGFGLAALVAPPRQS